MSDFQIVDPFEPRHLPASHAAPLLRPLPGAGIDFDIRPGTVDDIPWIDALQKEHKRGLGFMRFGELEGHLEKGHVYVAVATGLEARVMRAEEDATDSSLRPDASSLKPSRIAYCIAADRYYQRDEVGQVYQMCVPRKYQRQKIGANLLAKVWATWPRGVKLCGCWCAQDLEANQYWEGCGFTAVAFRAGSRYARGAKKGERRIHIYWQKRIRSGDGETPLWYPKQTSGGAMNEARIVFPIPPGSSWRDAKPAVYPGVEELFEKIAAEREAKAKQVLLQLAPPEGAEGAEPKLSRAERRKAEQAGKAQRDAKREEAELRDATAAGHGGLRLGWNAAPPEVVPTEEEVAAQEKAQRQASKRALREAKLNAKAAAKKAAKALRSQNDPVLVAAARDLRDRWMEAVQQDPGMLSLASEESAGARYDVARVIEDAPVASGVRRVENVRRLAA